MPNLAISNFMKLLYPDPKPVRTLPNEYKPTSMPGKASLKKRSKLTKKGRAKLAKSRRLNHRNH